MKKNGFTLVELLAVVIILALLAMFALPRVLNQFSNYREGLDEDQRQLIIEAARVYVNENVGKFLGGTVTNPKTYCIELETLVDDGALNKKFLDKTKFGDYIVKVTYDTLKHKIDVVEKTACTPT